MYINESIKYKPRLNETNYLSKSRYFRIIVTAEKSFVAVIFGSALTEHITCTVYEYTA